MRQKRYVTDLASAIECMMGDQQLLEQRLILDCGGCLLAIASNSAQLLTHLENYFAHVVTDTTTADIEIIAIERNEVELTNDFVDWKREPGKTGRKDAYLDLQNARLIRKVRTGMLFLQSEAYRIAAGDCLEHDNQVINFINAQYMNWLQQHDWLICHAAGLVRNGEVLAMAGLSGGGKSTLMLQLLEHDDVYYLSNDRLFIRPHGKRIDARGIPKLPRINPGTIVNNSRLQPLITAEKRAALRQLPVEELWDLEEKYDVDIQALYVEGRIIQQAPMKAFLVLNWQREGQQPLQLQQVDLQQRSDLLAAIMKSPGPFYQYADGRFFQDSTALDQQAYLRLLRDIPVLEASGGVDFSTLEHRCYTEILQ